MYFIHLFSMFSTFFLHFISLINHAFYFLLGQLLALFISTFLVSFQVVPEVEDDEEWKQGLEGYLQNFLTSNKEFRNSPQKVWHGSCQSRHKKAHRSSHLTQMSYQCNPTQCLAKWRIGPFSTTSFENYSKKEFYFQVTQCHVAQVKFDMGSYQAL